LRSIDIGWPGRPARAAGSRSDKKLRPALCLSGVA